MNPVESIQYSSVKIFFGEFIPNEYIYSGMNAFIPRIYSERMHPFYFSLMGKTESSVKIFLSLFKNKKKPGSKKGK